jgi:predicted nucleic acid-binding protein
MSGKPYFLDTNILIYGYTGQDEFKGEIANGLILGGQCLVSAQVLNEFCNTLKRKFPAQYLRVDVALAELASYLTVVPLAFSTTQSAVALSRRFGWSFYDSLIVAAAKEAQCSVVVSEDMQHGFSVDNRLRIENPFRPD